MAETEEMPRPSGHGRKRKKVRLKKERERERSGYRVEQASWSEITWKLYRRVERRRR
jgi:hypothetical protein